MMKHTYIQIFLGLLLVFGLGGCGSCDEQVGGGESDAATDTETDGEQGDVGTEDAADTEADATGDTGGDTGSDTGGEDAADSGTEDADATDATDAQDTADTADSADATDAEDVTDATDTAGSTDTSDADTADTYYGENSACDRALLSATGDVALVDPPASVVTGDTEDSSQMILFTERVEFTLPSALDVDTAATGSYDAYTDLSPTTIPAGTTVCSYYVHFDPVGSTLSYVSGSLTFPGQILGVIVLNQTLVDSHTVLQTNALPTTYPTAGGTQTEFDGMELEPLKDSFTLQSSGDALGVRFGADSASDAARILVEVSP